MKRHNFNAVRCSHYPNHPELYRLCDRLGSVVDEAEPETHGMTPMGRLARIPPGATPSWSGLPAWWPGTFKHPSIIIWSPGERIRLWRPGPRRHVSLGEGGGSQPSGAVRGAGPTPRPPTSSAPCTPVPTQDQPFPAVPKWALAKWIGLPEETRPLIPCEYAHAMGNSLGAMPITGRHFAIIRGCRVGLSGIGSIRAGQAPTMAAISGPMVAISGDTPTIASSCCNGLLFPIAPPSSLFEARRAQQPFVLTLQGRQPLTVEIRSEYLFRETDNETLQWRLCEDGVVVSQVNARSSWLPGGA